MRCFSSAKSTLESFVLNSSRFDDLVVCGIRPSVHAALSGFSRVGVSVTSVYKTLNGIEPNISAEER